jgi:hypothetical protein
VSLEVSPRRSAKTHLVSAPFALRPYSILRSSRMSTPQSLNSEKDEFAKDLILDSTTNASCHKLPVEIWRQIFEACVAHIPRAHDPLSSLLENPEQRKHPYTNIAISHVCRYFRHIALSTPVLWSTLNLDGPASEMDTFMERSEQLPLTITSLKGCFYTGYLRYPHMFATISERVVNIDTRVDDVGLKYAASCKNLKRIIVDENDDWYSDVCVERVLDEFEFLETLHYTRINSESLSFSSQKRYRLRSVHLTFTVPDSFLLSLFECCPALEYVSAHVIGTRIPPDDHRVRLPRLRDLRLAISREDSWASKIDVPQILDHLEFGYSLHYPKYTYQKWDMRTKSLELGDYLDLESMVSWLARETGALKTLTLRMQQKDQEKILEAFKANKKRAICPKLEQIHILSRLPPKHSHRLSDYTACDYEKIIFDIFSSRIQAGLPPLRFTLNEEVIVPKKTRPKHTAEISSIEENAPTSLPDKGQGTVRETSGASPIVKCVKWTRSKLRKLKPSK